MKTCNGSPRRRAARTGAAERAQLLAAFERSRLSAAAFARQHGIHYTTFCGWRQRRDKRPALPAFVQVELPPPSVDLVIELGPQTRLRITSGSQIELAARLLQAFNASRPC